ncbi:MAG: AbrB/MazE/SpoVT family DNA-binding domain-containing protein [Rhodospirillaceae bacterium]|nr:AbrB/MazE/SpoVT family DNA-binding domain-containing protein [Rhodospirillaceae bacterium]MDE0619070.1 AbrB/MazE/SpoVT family DNA-binding domain-containing protein [Rhodospirillaceae bacterium]
MAKVTSKLQVTVPKSLAVRYGIRPGDEIRFEEAGEVIRLVPPNGPAAESLDVEARLRLFDAATERQRAREAKRRWRPVDSRGWTREELYDRGRADTD